MESVTRKEIVAEQVAEMESRIECMMKDLGIFKNEIQSYVAAVQ
jgi:hypothetical protein